MPIKYKEKAKLVSYVRGSTTLKSGDYTLYLGHLELALDNVYHPASEYTDEVWRYSRQGPRNDNPVCSESVLKPTTIKCDTGNYYNMKTQGRTIYYSFIDPFY